MPEARIQDGVGFARAVRALSRVCDQASVEAGPLGLRLSAMNAAHTVYAELVLEASCVGAEARADVALRPLVALLARVARSDAVTLRFDDAELTMCAGAAETRQPLLDYSGLSLPVAHACARAEVPAADFHAVVTGLSGHADACVITANGAAGLSFAAQGWTWTCPATLVRPELMGAEQWYSTHMLAQVDMGTRLSRTVSLAFAAGKPLNVKYALAGGRLSFWLGSLR